MCFKSVQLRFKNHWSAKKIWNFLKKQYTLMKWSFKWAVLNRLKEAHYKTLNNIADLKSSINVMLEDIKKQNITMKKYVTIKVINFLDFNFETYIIMLNEQTRKKNKLSDLKNLFKSLKKKELWMKNYEWLHFIHDSCWERLNAYVTCSHCKKTDYTEERCWSLHSKSILKHLQEKFRKKLKAQKTKESQTRDSSTMIELMTVRIRRIFID